MAKTLDQIRWFLRSETAHAHRTLDTRIDTLDLGAPDEYATFLQVSHRGLGGVEAALGDFGVGTIFPDWPQARRIPCLERDMAALGLAVPPTAPAWPVTTPCEALGALYVIEGSRLGNRILLDRAARSGDARVKGNLRYLSHGHHLPFWRNLLQIMEDRVTDQSDFATARAGALRAFDVFIAAATIMIPDHPERCAT